LGWKVLPTSCLVVLIGAIRVFWLNP